MEVKEKIISLLSEQLGINAKDIDENSLLVEDLGMDSLDVIEGVMSVEKEFKLRINDNIISGIKTVGDIIEVVESMVAER